MKEAMNYKQAFTKLEEITKLIEIGEVPIEDLVKKVEQAKELLKICELKLRGVEEGLGK